MEISSPIDKKPNQYDVLSEIVEYIVNKVDPKMIILFGSCARGMATSQSDIDLCVVVEGKADIKKRVEIRSQLLMDLLDITEFEVDLLICSLEDWEKKHMDQGTFIGKVYKEGKLIYGR
ncbi:MAG: nucleotidyltransferase domain-containing protein [Tissierellia bacterium]|nr:nucleotidyltransferase domain-containing protein [Tissierellia bacterium]